MSAAWTALIPAAAAVLAVALYFRKENNNGSWKSDQADGSDTKSYPGKSASSLTSAELRTRALTAIGPGSVTPMATLPFAAQIQQMHLQQMLMQSQSVLAQQAMGGMMGGGPLPPQMPNHLAIQQMAGVQGLNQNIMAGAAESLATCPKCGTALVGKSPHECPTASELDTAVIRTIQTLAAAGLSPEEIAGDMKLMIGYRRWTAKADLAGAGSGSTAAWPIDKPTIAVCVKHECAMRPGRREACVKQPYPMCRVHAWKTPELNKASGYSGVSGAVALWGDVIECEKGYLASRAYPLGFDSEGWARGYRVAFIKPPQLDPQP